jgi:hypothetical protein
MNITQATTRLRKLLGKTATVRDYKRPSTQAERDALLAKRRALRERMKDAEKAHNDRAKAVLAADAEYQWLKMQWREAHTEYEALPFPRWRYEVVTKKSIFTCVEKSADTLAELVEKVEADKVRA